uniref:Keratin-associated protein 5-2-like n=1 Tax=Nicotiana sylvestris TaxID=4096 RepID=A0A1U7WFS9_NICSY|nr:PREDICTED: keratin-associated protein 5-2-like [Nicotiana sylvestris]
MYGRCRGSKLLSRRRRPEIDGVADEDGCDPYDCNIVGWTASGCDTDGCDTDGCDPSCDGPSGCDTDVCDPCGCDTDVCDPCNANGCDPRGREAAGLCRARDAVAAQNIPRVEDKT